MTLKMGSPRTSKPEGPFVLITFEGDEFLFDDRHNVVKINGRPKKMDVKRNYFESDRKRLVRTVLIFTESSDQLSRATDRVPGLPASPGYVQ